MIVFFEETTKQTIRYALQHDVDLICKNSATAPVKNQFSSQDFQLIRQSPQPVLLFRENLPSKWQRILVAVDPTDIDHIGESLHANLLRTAAHLALLFKSELHVIHVWELAEENDLRHGLFSIPEKEIDQLLTELSEQRNAEVKKLIERYIPEMTNNVQLDILKGEPSTVIANFINEKQIELLIVGTVGRSGLSGFFLGNTAENIIRSANCSVLALKPDTQTMT